MLTFSLDFISPSTCLELLCKFFRRWLLIICCTMLFGSACMPLSLLHVCGDTSDQYFHTSKQLKLGWFDMLRTRKWNDRPCTYLNSFIWEKNILPTMIFKLARRFLLNACCHLWIAVYFQWVHLNNFIFILGMSVTISVWYSIHFQFLNHKCQWP